MKTSGSIQVYIQMKEKQGLYNLNYGVIRLTQASEQVLKFYLDDKKQ
jgi:hypothetical protein